MWASFWAHSAQFWAHNVCGHEIEIELDAKLVKKSRYRMNQTYAAQVKEEINKLVKTKFVYPVDGSKWLSPIIIVAKNNGQLRVCVDYNKLNAVTKSDPFPLPFMKSIVETVHNKMEEMSCSTLYGFT